MKQNNLKRNTLFLVYFLGILLSVLLFKPEHITTNMLAIFQNDENIEKLKTMNSFEQASTLFVTIKGHSKEHRDTLLELEKKLQKFDFIKSTKFNTSKIEISEYMKKNYYLLSEFSPIELNEKTIKKHTQELRDSLINDMFYTPIDKNDPFKLFTFNLGVTQNLTKDGFLTLGEHGYLLTAQLNVKVSDMENARKVESELSSFFAPYKEVLSFSTLFFTAQNSTIIEANVHTILYISFALLILLFFITLRDYKLLLANTITLGSSVLFALGVSTFVFEEVSIFTLAFGAAISSMSVDYLFHNYFHGQYKKKGINYSIMLAFLTTVLGFAMLGFVAFPLISQLSVFAIFSLSFSYFQFTFLYPYLKLEPKENRVDISFFKNIKSFLPVNLIFVFSLLTIFYATLNIEFDYNFRNLDYDNKELKVKQAIIEDAMVKKTILLIEGESLDNLMKRVTLLQNKLSSMHSLAKFALTQEEFKNRKKVLKEYDFALLKTLLNKSAEEVGFKKNYFSDSYTFVKNIPQIYRPKIEAFKELGYEVIEKNSKFYTTANILKEDIGLVANMAFVSVIDAAALIKLSMTTMFKSLFIYIILSFLAIVVIISFIVKKRAILALSFILFPIAVVLLYLSFIQVNLMHLFSIIIIIVAGIDYGIYMSQENSKETNEAILYSLFTTFSGFGILILSSVGAIHSIGEVITIGILSIVVLVLFLKKY